ncbi:MAG TPA: ATP-dependent Clp protease ATP-binding subunit ClpX [candidate division Zixibacteria bacterium]|nr:ATP-dependent Clp protease ATP-binding subunit ClpX [candidate division Zixibacteria bacterium]
MAKDKTRGDGPDDPKLTHRCSFCGKPSGQVKRLFAGHESYICNECVGLCSDILDSAAETDTPTELVNIPTPQEIKEHLDSYVIGQEGAKKAVSVAVYNHYKRINHLVKRASSHNDETDIDVDLEKSNILLMGPTGTGKTLIARTLAKFLRVPFCIADATVLTEAGYVGEDVENILVRLYQAANFDPVATERGIIYVDEIDKISRTDGNPSITRDVSGEGVQQGLLKILEGTVANIPPKGGRKHPEQAFVQIDTSNILFICGGAFDGLEKIIARRVGNKQLGFEADRDRVQADDGDIMTHVTPGDLLEYGLIPELIGRLPVTAPLETLDEAALLSILTEPRNAVVKQYQRLFEMDGFKLSFEHEALEAAVAEAKKRKTGARALRSVFEKAMLELMYNAPSMPDVEEIIVTKDVIEGTGPAKFITRRQKKKSA